MLLSRMVGSGWRCAEGCASRAVPLQALGRIPIEARPRLLAPGLLKKRIRRDFFTMRNYQPRPLVRRAPPWFSHFMGKPLGGGDALAAGSAAALNFIAS